MDEIKAMVHGRHATGDLSFSLTMGASSNQRHEIQHNAPVDLQEHMSDSDEADEDDCNEQAQLSAGEKVDHVLEVFTPTLESIEMKVEVQVIEDD